MAWQVVSRLKRAGGVGLQVPAILNYLRDRGLRLQGREVVDIGSFGGASHAISDRLNPSQIPCVVDPRVSLERWWQKKKRLAVWEEGR